MTEVDVLIVGGGPAGLLAGSYLSKSHRVALIERGPFGQTSKYWVTTERRLAKHQLTDHLLHKAGSMIVGTYLGSQATGDGDLAVVDDARLMMELLGRCRTRGVLLSEGSTLVNLSWTKQHVQAQSTGETYRARVVVDATGVDSPIAATFRLHKLDGFFSVFGAHVSPIELHTSAVVLAYVNLLGYPPPILEVIPTGENSAYCAVFCYSKLLTPPSALESSFKSSCERNPFFSMCPATRFDRPKTGAIAIGQRQRRTLPGVVSIGDAALVQPPLLGTSFNELLEYVDQVCEHLARGLDHTPGPLIKANFRYPILKRSQDRLQLALMRVLLRTDVEAFDKLVGIMGRLPRDLVFRFCSNELSWPDLLSTAARLPYNMIG